MKLLLKLIALTIFTTLALAATAQRDAGAKDLLEELEKKYSAVSSVTGTFSQSLTSKAFSNAKQQGARFQLLKPDNFRVDYQEPAPSTNLITDRTFYQYVPSLKQVNVAEFNNQATIQDLNYLLLGFGAKADEVLRVYNASLHKGGKGVRLTPRNAATANFKHIDMQLSNDLIPQRFTMEQKDGNILTVNINPSSLNMRANLSPADFTPNFPRPPQANWINQ